MSELAYDLNGEPISLPASAQWWKVRRFRNPGTRGAPELVVDRDGAPVIVPVDTTFVDFREVVDAVPGRYRLDPLDEQRRVVANVPAAYVTINEAVRPMPTSVAAVDDRDLVIRELVRAQADMVKTMSERFSNVMQAAAELLRAADGAGLPARPPMAIVESDEDDDDDDDDEVVALPAAPPTPLGLDINALVAQVVPMVVMGIVNGKLDLSKLGEIFDWRKAAAKGKTAVNGNASAAALPEPAASGTSSSEASVGAAKDEENSALPSLDPKAMTHFIAIQSALTAEEGAMARAIAKELSPAELRAWFNELLAMSVPDAVAKIRSIIGAGGTKRAADGGAS